MKRLTKAVFCSLAALAAASSIGAYKYNRMKSLPLNLSEGFTVTAHTGCEDTPENSLDSIRAGIDAGADVVEFDLNFDSEGKPVLSHDAPKGNEVSLESALALISEYEKVQVNVDVKTAKNLQIVEELSEKYGLIGRVFYTGIEEKDIEAAKATPLIPYYLNIGTEKSKLSDEEYLNSLADLVEETGAIGINLNFNRCNEKLVEVFHQRKLLVSLWTANREREMYRCLSYSPDNITTKAPSVLSEIISNKSKS